MTRPQRIELEIGELVLHGFDPADRHRIGAAVRTEIARLLREHAPEIGADRDIQHVTAGTIRFRADQPERAGRDIARVVHGRLSP